MPVTAITPQNFEMFSGNTKPVTIDVLDQDGNAVDLTGGSATLTVSPSSTSAQTFQQAATLPGTPNNRLQFTIEPADTEALQGVHYWEAEFTDVSGRVSTVAFGAVNIKPNNS